MRRVWLLATAVILGLAPAAGLGAPADCAIVEGVAIGGVRLGMAAQVALAVTGAPARQQAVGTQVIYALRPPWVQMVADYGTVQRVATRAAECRTSRGVGPGSSLAAVREAYTGASVIAPGPDGEVLTYPFVGVAFWLRGERVEAVEIFRAEGGLRAPAAAPQPAAPQSGTTPAAAPAAPSPTPTTAPGSWSVRSSSARVDDGDLVVSGVVENRSRALAAYAEVRAFNGAGRRVGEGNAPLQPSPVPSGGTARFEVRLAIDDVARRYAVTIRPAGAGGVLAEHTGEIKALQIFGAVVARQLQVKVQAASPTPLRTEFSVVVTNGSSLALAGASVTVEITVTCRVVLARVIAQEVWTGSVAVPPLAPGASAQAALRLSGGGCEGIALSWTATHRVSDVRIAE